MVDVHLDTLKRNSLPSYEKSAALIAFHRRPVGVYSGLGTIVDQRLRVSSHRFQPEPAEHGGERLLGRLARFGPDFVGLPQTLGGRAAQCHWFSGGGFRRVSTGRVAGWLCGSLDDDRFNRDFDRMDADGFWGAVPAHLWPQFAA